MKKSLDQIKELNSDKLLDDKKQSQVKAGGTSIVVDDIIDGN